MKVAENYINYEKLDDGNLKITFDLSGKDDIEQELAMHPEWSQDTKLCEILDSMLCNGWTSLHPSDIGITSDVFLIADCDDVELDDDGEVVDVNTVYWYPQHVVHDPVKRLLETGEITLTGVFSCDHSNIDKLEKRNKRWAKAGNFCEDGTLPSHTSLGGYTIIYVGDGTALCADCALNDPSVDTATTYDEGPTIYCDNPSCNKEIESSYGDPDDDEQEEETGDTDETVQDPRIAPFPFRPLGGGEYQFSARWEDICKALPENGRSMDIRLASHSLEALNVLWDGEMVFVNLDEINNESVWVVYWNPPYTRREE